jgi:glycosyltransferase involved in cell wall biosynthesis
MNRVPVYTEQGNLAPQPAAESPASRLRVAFVVDAIRGRNGVGTYYDDLLGHISEQVGDARVFCPDESRPETFQRFSLPLPGDSTQRLYLPRFRGMLRQLGELSPHIVVLPTPGPYCFTAWWYAWRNGIPVCAAYQTDYESLFGLYWHPWMARFAGLVWRRIQANFLRKGQLVVTISRQMQQRAYSAGVSEAHLIGTPLGREFIENPLKPLTQGLERFLFVGRLAKEKNVDSILESARRMPHLHFAIAGDGPMRPLVEREAAALPNLEYLGWLPRSRVIEALDRSDMLILPSSVEAFGTVILEAMARNRLVCVSRTCGAAEWPELKAALYLIEEGEDLAAAIQRIRAEDPEQRARKAELARMAARRLNAQTVETWTRLLVQTAMERTPRTNPLPRTPQS